MIRFSANLGLLFADAPLPQRFSRAAEAGFRTVEIWSPYLDSMDDLVKAKDAAGVEIVQFNMDRIDLRGGERGTAAIPEYTPRFRADAELAIETAKRLGARRFNALVGNRSEAHSREAQIDCLKENLRWAHALLAQHDLTLVIEPLCLQLNPHYLLPRPDEVFALVRELNLPHLKVQYDLFHAQMAEGNLTATLKENLPLIGNIQVADAPGRHQPGTGEINYRFVLGEIEALGYAGHVALEFIPSGTMDEALAWLPREHRAEGQAGALKL
jgi:hydroxypyruvate isomerase